MHAVKVRTNIRQNQPGKSIHWVRECLYVWAESYFSMSTGSEFRKSETKPIIWNAPFQADFWWFNAFSSGRNTWIIGFWKSEYHSLNQRILSSYVLASNRTRSHFEQKWLTFFYSRSDWNVWTKWKEWKGWASKAHTAYVLFYVWFSTVFGFPAKSLLLISFMLCNNISKLFWKFVSCTFNFDWMCTVYTQHTRIGFDSLEFHNCQHRVKYQMSDCCWLKL